MEEEKHFFQLPYLEFNLLRHNLDVMHIEKNVCDNVIFTLINDKDKRNDHVEARKDLQAMDIRRDLWPPDDGRKFLATLFTLAKEEIYIMLNTLKNITVPDGYLSNISRCVDTVQHKIFGLKSHDSHILMEQLLPLSIRNVLPLKVATILVDLCTFFKLLCAKVLSHDDLDKLKEQITLTLCHLEMLFPPSFFTVMIHLTVHLVDEAKLGGPVHYRWMYPIESWKLLLGDYKDKAWIKVIKAKLWWDPIHEAAARTYIMKDMGKKWRENRINLFNTYYDPTKSRAENTKNPPLSISQIEWATFLNYRLREKTKELSQKNTENRSKLKINHTGGSKKLKRRMAEIVSETGQEVSRGVLFIDTHKKVDGTYINEEARVVCVKIAEIESQGTAPVLWQSHRMTLLVKYWEKSIQAEYEVWEMEFAHLKCLDQATHDFGVLLLLLI